MLDVADYVLRLGAFDEFGDQGSGQDGVFAEILEGAAIAGFAGQVDAAAERHVVALGAQFGADQLAVFVGGIGIPAGGGRHVGGQGCGVAPVGAAGAHAVSCVAHVDAGNAQAGNADLVADAAIGGHVLCSERIVGGHADAMQRGDLLVERHLFNDQVGAFVGRKAGVHPGAGGFGVACGGVGESRGDEEGNRKQARGSQIRARSWECFMGTSVKRFSLAE